MKYVKLILAAFIFMFAFASPIVAVTTSTPVSAACGEEGFLGIPPWYRGLVDSNCNITGPEDKQDGLQEYIIKIALNIVEMAMVIVGYIALFFILYGGFQFLTGGANPGQVEKARNTILHAVIGLVIALSAVAIVRVIFWILGE